MILVLGGGNMATTKKTTAPEVVETTTEPVVTEKPAKKEPKVVTAKVNSPTGLNCRATGSADAEILMVLPFEAPVTVEGKTTGEWTKITASDGTVGFVMTQFLDF